MRAHDRPAAHDPDVALESEGALGELNRAGVLVAADVHVATRVARMAGEDDPGVVLALALAVRGARLGSSSVDLAAVRAELAEDHAPLLPDITAWLAALTASPLAGPGDEGAVLVVEGVEVALARFHALETSLAARLAARLGRRPPPVDQALLEQDLARLFPDADSRDQRAAAATAARSWTSVVTGGPGTGKTTTVARLLTALDAQHAAAHADGGAEGVRPLAVGLAAPTGKAAARLRASLVEASRATMLTERERERLASLRPVTLHRLLGPRPDHRTAFTHHRGQRLPYDVVVVDETSMVSLLMMERLVQAVADGCRLILVGDAEQLASVEAGAVLRDVIDGLEDVTARLGEVPVTRLRRGFRFSGAIGDLAEAIVRGDVESALAVLDADDAAVRLVDPDLREDVVLDVAGHQAHEVARAAARGDVPAAEEALSRHRLLCAHREGPVGVAHWNERLERRVRAFHDPARPWFVGRPVLMTRNDAGLGVNNGDVGVTVEVDGRLVVAFETGRRVAAARLASAQSAFAATVHRSQGSEFDHVTLLLPEADSPIATRELLYTAVTRARERLTLVGTREDVAAAIERRTARASGVAGRLAAALGAAGAGREEERP